MRAWQLLLCSAQYCNGTTFGSHQQYRAHKSVINCNSGSRIRLMKVVTLLIHYLTAKREFASLLHHCNVTSFGLLVGSAEKKEKRKRKLQQQFWFIHRTVKQSKRKNVKHLLLHFPQMWWLPAFFSHSARSHFASTSWHVKAALCTSCVTLN